MMRTCPDCALNSLSVVWCREKDECQLHERGWHLVGFVAVGSVQRILPWLFASLGDVRLVPGHEIAAAMVRDTDLLLVRSVTPVNAALLDNSRVKFVATATIGTDHVDQSFLLERGIGFASAEGSNANSVAEYVVAALLE